MPIVGVASTATSPGCAGQLILKARTTAVFNRPAVEKLRSLSMPAGAAPTIEWDFRDRDGAAVSLIGCVPYDPISPSSSSSSLGASPSPLVVQLRIAEAAALSGSPVISYPGEVFDAAAGRVTVVIDRNIAAPSVGINHAEIGVFDPLGHLIFSNRFWLVVEPGLFGGACASPAGRLSIQEIRLTLRDNSPVEHNLIDTVLFDDAEIALAIRSAVDYWNEALPPLAPYTTANFPYRYNWMQAACSRLFSMLAQYYRDNHLAYQSQGGISVDDMNKAKAYDDKADAMWAEYKSWVASRKAAENLATFWGILSSPYSGYSSHNW